ncbi:ABC transporter [Candidatus Saccharibacteria bacterium HGW-Saccharibacteria-1]|nr:MAG: ABC transporter [Candidatus Saccharibacteria bacterium HGW-Saccharibacteria-1]
MNIIETKKLTKYYGKSLGISEIDLEIKEGEIFGFIGPNGAGKSTTIRTLLGLVYPTSGSATIFGKDIIEFGPEIKEDIGYLPSEVFYYDGMRVIDLLKYSGSFYKKDQAVILKKIKELAEYLDLDLKKKIDDLSYGNKKKVGIIQGLLHEPKLIILDEPTGGLDPLMQQRFFDLLREENKKGVTILFSSHILSEVQKLCDRVAIIKDGKIVKIDNIKDLAKDTHKRFKLEFKGEIDRKQVTELIGVSDLAFDDNNASFLLKGNINEAIKLIAGFELTNLLVEEPDLEEIFMHYYVADKK